MPPWPRGAASPNGAEQASPAALSSGRLAVGLGRYRLGEACLLRASRAGGDVADEAWRLLELLYWMSGRRDEHRAILQARAEQAADPSKTLRVLWSIERDPYPVDGITAALAKARQSAPDDDLVWLASANLAIRTGRFDEAGAWLDRCERARPDDPAVWRARLEWAKAAGRPDEVRRAAAHLPASGMPRADDARDAGLARGSGWRPRRPSGRPSRRSSRRSRPMMPPSSDWPTSPPRPASRGRSPSCDAARRRSMRPRDHYRQLINLPEMAPHAAEFARTAEAIGRWFEAKTWWALAARRDPSLADEASGRDRPAGRQG